MMTKPAPARSRLKKGTVPFLLCLLCALAILPACGGRSYANQNDELRADKLGLEQALADMQKKLRLRENEVRALREQLNEEVRPIEGVEPPRLAGLVLGMYSGPIDEDGDLEYDALRVYVRPVDQHGRQMTAIGPCRVRLIEIPAEGDPITLLDVRVTADEFHNAYRSGVTGTHYTLKADLPDDRPTHATLHVTLTDAATGRSYAVEKPVVLRWDAKADR